MRFHTQSKFCPVKVFPLVKSLLAQISNLLDFGGELLDARHNPPLLVEWGEGDFEAEKFVFLQAVSARGASGIFGKRTHPNTSFG